MSSSAAGKHHASQQAHSTKRKEPPADHTPPKSKKAAASVRKSDHVKPSDDAQQALRERHRQAVSALYTAYDQLSGTSKDEASDAAAYNTLLDGAKGGTCAQRVAARLIPRFAHRFPQKLEQAAAALISITGSHSSTKDPDGVRALSKAARPEALHGLAKVCEAASGVASSAGGAVVTKAAEVLLRRMSSEVNAKTSTPAAGSTSEPACALQSLQSAFRSSTRVILATSLQGLKSEDGKTRDGSRYFLQQLLAPPQPATAAGGATANGHASNASGPGLCLAAEVLAVQTDTQHWLRNTAKAFRAEPPKHRGKEALALLDRLLAALPADAPPHLAVTQPLAAAGKTADTAAPLPPPPLAAPAQPEKPLPPPPPAISADQAFGGAAASTPADDDSDINMDLEEGQLADSPVAPPPLPPPATPNTAPPPQPQSAPAAPAPDPAALRPGGMLCRAAATLWLGRVPRLVGEASLRKECAKAGGVERVVFPVREEALVTFAGMREAALAYEQLCGTAPWGGPRLDVEFCSEDGQPAASSGARRPVAVWVGGPCNPAGEAEVVATLKAAGVPPASGVLRVGGARPGLMMQFADEAAGSAALAALLAGKDGPRSAAGRDDTCTVVVSQVSPAVHERELLGAFARIAEPVRWHTSRGGATIAFRTPSAAAAAVQALDGVSLGPSRIRVTLKAPPPDAAKSAAASASEPDRARSAASTPSPSPANLPTAAAANGPPGFGGGGGSSTSRRRRRGWDEGPPAGHPAAGAPPLPAPPPKSDPSPGLPPQPSAALSPAPSSAPSPAQAPLQAEQAPPRAVQTAAVAAEPPWKGLLGRPSVQPCKVVCLDTLPASAQLGGLAASEPDGWPPLLEVRSRISTTLLTGQKLPALARQDVAVRRLAPEGPSNRHAFIRFMQYLSDKQRSGVVELGPAGGGGASRTLYIVPPSRTVCDELHVAWDHEEILVAVVVPAMAKDVAPAPQAQK